MKLSAMTALTLITLCTASGAFAGEEGTVQVTKYTMKDIDGQQVDLARYQGKVLMVVNVASKCGLTPQYTQLVEIRKKYKDQGFEILGFPANNFMGQEPGTNEEIKTFCSTRYGVSFPMFSKLRVVGDQKHELYKWLTESSSPAGDVRWNFEKFLVGKDGSIVRRFGSGTAPSSAELVDAIEKALGAGG